MKISVLGMGYVGLSNATMLSTKYDVICHDIDESKLESIEKKWEAFGFYVKRVNGHSHEEIINTLNEMSSQNKPSVMIADTTKGKGISFMENEPNWHYWNKIDNEKYKLAKNELEKELKKYE